MSHTTNVQQTNVNIYVKQTNIIGAQVGMDGLAPPKTVSEAAQNFEKSVMPKFLEKWKADFPSTTLPAGNCDFGYMGPWSELTPGESPKCVVDQVNMDLENWGLPVVGGLGDQIARSISQSVYSHGGQAAISRGVTQAGANESIDWLLLSGQVYISQRELGIVYLFAAALDVGGI